ncbi:MAG: hypothetical protein R3E68_03080 [Burkholderiaceae bacterium]
MAGFAQRMISRCHCRITQLTLPYDPAPAARLSENFVSESSRPLVFEVSLHIVDGAAK